jgi:hypothetical protein
MRRSSSTWLFSACLLLVGAAAGEARLCLPPAYEGGKRLQAMPAPDAFWLELLLRQHEVCWRRGNDGEARVFLIGDSGPLGFPGPADQAVAGVLNRRFDETGVRAHVFNFGLVTTYQLKDALILRLALDYQPDVILYPITLGAFIHVAPVIFPSLSPLMDANMVALREFAAGKPAGLGEPLERYRASFAQEPPRGVLWKLRQLGTLVRSAVRHYAKALTRLLTGEEQKLIAAADKGWYDCARTKQQEQKHFVGWQSWNVLAWLEQVSRERGIPVLLVNWPTQRVPLGECYNPHHTRTAIEEWDVWLRNEAAARGLTYLDLREMLGSGDFVDTRHIMPHAHRKVAEALAPTLEEMVRARAAARSR